MAAADATVSVPLKTNIPEVDRVLPPGALFLTGLQHVLVLYVGAVAVPLLLGAALKLDKEQVAYLINADLFTCGIATLVQSLGIWKIGIRLPVMQGCTLMALGAMVSIGSRYGVHVVFGSIIAGGVVAFLLAPVYSKVLRFFPQVVVGSIIMVVGMSLTPAALGWIVGGAHTAIFQKPFNFGLAALVLAIIVVINRFVGGFWANISVLISLIIGFAISGVFGYVDLSGVSQEHWLGLDMPMAFGTPTFQLSAVFSMAVVMLVVMAETIGVYLTIGEIAGRPPTENDITRGLRAEGINTFIAGFLNAFPYTSFTQNVGLVALTNVKSRYTVAVGGIILVLMGMIPKLAIIIASIPTPILGGVGVAVFSSVAAQGVRTLSKVDMNDSHNQLIVALTIGVGMMAVFGKSLGSFAQFPDWARMLMEDGQVAGAITAILVAAVFGKRREMGVLARSQSQAQEASVPVTEVPTTV